MSIKCTKCNKKFKSDYLLNKHLNQKVPCDSTIKFICNKCKKEFKSDYHLQRHNSRKTTCVNEIIETNSNSMILLEIEKEKTKRELEKLKLKIELENKKQQTIEKEYENKKEEIELRRLKNLEIEQTKTDRKGTVSDCCYVITNEVYEKNNMFKFGRTACSKKELISCYSRGLPNPKILLFYKTDTATQDELNILTYLKEYRIDGPNRKSEWLKIEFEILKNYLEEYFKNSIINENENENEKNGYDMDMENINITNCSIICNA